MASALGFMKDSSVPSIGFLPSWTARRRPTAAALSRVSCALDIRMRELASSLIRQSARCSGARLQKHAASTNTRGGDANRFTGKCAVTKEARPASVKPSRQQCHARALASSSSTAITTPDNALRESTFGARGVSIGCAVADADQVTAAFSQIDDIFETIDVRVHAGGTCGLAD